MVVTNRMLGQNSSFLAVRAVRGLVDVVVVIIV